MSNNQKVSLTKKLCHFYSVEYFSLCKMTILWQFIATTASTTSFVSFKLFIVRTDINEFPLWASIDAMLAGKYGPFVSNDRNIENC